MKDLSKDFQYFIQNHDSLLNLYSNKYVVISNEQVVTSADTLEEGIDKALEKGLELGSFIVQLCTEGEDAYTQRFHSRVVFA